MSAEVCVVGAGVIGLSSALCIAQSLPSVRVTVVAAAFSPETVSDGSGGFWFPHHVVNTDEGLLR